MTIKFTGFGIDIYNFNNAAMVDNPEAEVVEILRQVIRNIESRGLDNIGGPVRDSNGNHIGSINVGFEES
jgi:hypothetical protein